MPSAPDQLDADAGQILKFIRCQARQLFKGTHPAPVEPKLDAFSNIPVPDACQIIRLFRFAQHSRSRWRDFRGRLGGGTTASLSAPSGACGCPRRATIAGSRWTSCPSWLLRKASSPVPGRNGLVMATFGFIQGRPGLVVLQPQFSRYSRIRLQSKPPGGSLTARMAETGLPALGPPPQRPSQLQLRWPVGQW